MFEFPRHVLAAPGLEQMLGLINAEPPSPPREIGMTVLAYDLVHWFDVNPQLQSVRLTCVLHARIAEAGEGVRLSHHVKLVTSTNSNQPLKDVPCSQAEVDAFAQDRLPWKLLGNGTCEVSRTHPVVQRLLLLDPEKAHQVSGAFCELAQELNACFSHVNVVQDLGLSSQLTE